MRLSGHGTAAPEDARFRFRLFTPEDLPDLRALHGDRESMRYMSPDGEPWDDARLLWWVDYWRQEYESAGYTKWRVEAAEDGRFLGRAGISPMPDDPDQAELGYSLVRSEWGKGLATELAIVVRDWAWRATTLPHLIGITRLGNTASQRVLAKIGMVPEGEREFRGGPCAFFRLDRPG